MEWWPACLRVGLFLFGFGSDWFISISNSNASMGEIAVKGTFGDVELVANFFNGEFAFFIEGGGGGGFNAGVGR